MLRQRIQVYKRERGFTLIELMIVVAIIGILAAIAVPNFINYRNKSRIAAGVSTGESLRAALASFAADSANNLFPDQASIGNWGNLTTIINRNGGTLKALEGAVAGGAGISFIGYSVSDTDGDLTNDTYTLTLSVSGVPGSYEGQLVQLTPQGILRCPTDGKNVACP